MSPRHPNVADLTALMEQWAPAWTAESWDRVGLVSGQPGARVARAWVALDLDQALVTAALAANVDMIFLHHPPLFKPLTDLRSDRPATARLLKAATAGLAIFAAHTNLDAAPGGVNDALAQRLGMSDPRPLIPLGQEGLAKLVTFVPPDHYDEVAAALFAAGAGRIGAYQDCAFLSGGEGRFLPLAEAQPYLGRPGQPQRVEELRVEMLVPLASASAAVKALRAAHPYQEPAVDLYPLRQSPAGFGMGRVGELSQPQAPEAFAAWAAAELGARAPLLCGAPPAELTRVAVVGGSGGDMLAEAARAGAQMLVTGEARYHAAEQAADLGLGLLTLGHYQTEAVIIEPWVRRLTQQLTQAGLTCQVESYAAGQDPWHRPTAGAE